MNTNEIKEEFGEDSEKTELEKLLHRVIEIDSDAQKITSKAESMKDDSSEIIAARKKEFEKEYSEKAEKEIALFKEQAERTAEKELNDCKNRVENEKSVLKKKVASSKEKWIDEITKAVIGSR